MTGEEQQKKRTRTKTEIRKTPQKRGIKRNTTKRKGKRATDVHTRSETQ